jgi:hypothetical protein
MRGATAGGGAAACSVLPQGGAVRCRGRLQQVVACCLRLGGGTADQLGGRAGCGVELRLGRCWAGAAEGSAAGQDAARVLSRCLAGAVKQGFLLGRLSGAAAGCCRMGSDTLQAGSQLLSAAPGQHWPLILQILAGCCSKLGRFPMCDFNAAAAATAAAAAAAAAADCVCSTRKWLPPASSDIDSAHSEDCAAIVHHACYARVLPLLPLPVLILPPGFHSAGAGLFGVGCLMQSSLLGGTLLCTSACKGVHPPMHTRRCHLCTAAGCLARPWQSAPPITSPPCSLSTNHTVQRLSRPTGSSLLTQPRLGLGATRRRGAD